MLTDAACRNANCADDKPRARYADAGGLYLEVAASGSKRWFVKYRFGGKEKRLALGNYPLVSLKEAREGRDKARKARGEGQAPSRPAASPRSSTRPPALRPSRR